jgi:hypothetical protein
MLNLYKTTYITNPILRKDLKKKHRYIHSTTSSVESTMVYFVINLTSFKLQTNILPYQFISEYGLWSNNVVLYQLAITI